MKIDAKTKGWVSYKKYVLIGGYKKVRNKYLVANYEFKLG